MFQYDNFYETILNNATKNWKSLKMISNKDRLNMIKMLAIIFWSRLSNRQIAKLLIIIGSPTMLGDKMKHKVQKKINFTKEDILNLDYDILYSFRLQNKSLH